MAQLHTAIHTPRLTLRRFRPTDLDSLCALYDDERVARYLYFEVRDREENRASLELKLSRPLEITVENVLPVAAVLKDSERVVGDFMLRWSVDEHHQGEIGGSLSVDVQGQGLAAEVYVELLALGFHTYNLHRIIARCDGRNFPSIRSLEKAGLHREAHLVENEFVKGEWTDEVIMAVRHSEWNRPNVA